jgi:phage tail-like protein
MPGGRFRSPFDAHQAARYIITVDGYEVGQFSELVELSSTIEPSSTADPDEDPDRRSEPPGERSSVTVTLMRAQTDDLSMFTWHRGALDDAGARRDAVLVMYSVEGAPIERYALTGAWPTQLTVTGEPTAGVSELLYETVTLTCEDIQRVSV